jgi:hypothetical protein
MIARYASTMADETVQANVVATGTRSGFEAIEEFAIEFFDVAGSLPTAAGTESPRRRTSAMP